MQQKIKVLKKHLGETPFNREFYLLKKDLIKSEQEYEFSLIIDLMYDKFLTPSSID